MDSNLRPLIGRQTGPLKLLSFTFLKWLNNHFPEWTLRTSSCNHNFTAPALQCGFSPMSQLYVKIPQLIQNAAERVHFSFADLYSAAFGKDSFQSLSLSQIFQSCVLSSLLFIVFCDNLYILGNFRLNCQQKNKKSPFSF